MSRNSSPKPDNHVIVLFGATGDLAKRKLLPGLFHLATSDLLPEQYRIIGTAPAAHALTDEQFRAHAKDSVQQFGRVKPTGAAWKAFASRLSFGAADADDAQPLLAEVWRRGSVVSSWLMDLTAAAFAKSPDLSDFSGRVSDSGEGRWTVLAAVDEGVPASVIAASLYERFESRDLGAFTGKILSAMRSEFGGHAEKKA